jgi:hypothetical protein
MNDRLCLVCEHRAPDKEFLHFQGQRMCQNCGAMSNRPILELPKSGQQLGRKTLKDRGLIGDKNG